MTPNSTDASANGIGEAIAGANSTNGGGEAEGEAEGEGGQREVCKQCPAGSFSKGGRSTSCTPCASGERSLTQCKTQRFTAQSNNMLQQYRLHALCRR